MICAIEGCDAAGKASICQALLEYLKSLGKDAEVIAFPRYSGPVGSLIKETLCTPNFRPEILQSLMLADRLAAVDILANPNKEIICDRYYMSGIVYGAVEGLNEPWLYSMHQTLPRADVQILLDIDPLISSKRRDKPRDENEKNIDKLQAIRKKYLDIWHVNSANQFGVWYVVNANQEFDFVKADVRKAYDHSQLMKSYNLSSYAAF
jgi:dTMP kinase